MYMDPLAPPPDPNDLIGPHTHEDLTAEFEVYALGLHELGRQVWTMSRHHGDLLFELLARVSVLFKAVGPASQVQAMRRWADTRESFKQIVSHQNASLYKERVRAHEEKMKFQLLSESVVKRRQEIEGRWCGVVWCGVVWCAFVDTRPPTPYKSP